MEHTPLINQREESEYLITALDEWEFTTNTSVKAAWLACAIDSEGHIGYSKRFWKGRISSLRPRVTITNTNQDYLSLAAKLLDDFLILHYRYSSLKWGSYVTVQRVGHVRQLLAIVIPYLVINKDRARDMFQDLTNREDKRA